MRQVLTVIEFRNLVHMDFFYENFNKKKKEKKKKAKCSTHAPMKQVKTPSNQNSTCTTPPKPTVSLPQILLSFSSGPPQRALPSHDDDDDVGPR